MMKKRLNVLVATNHLKKIGGSETFTFTLIEELKKREHINVEYFTFQKGLVSKKIEELGVPFFSNKKKYDLILANHNTTVNKLYKKGFILQTCHGIYPKIEQPSVKADAYVAISQEIQEHIANLGYSSQIIYNGINLNRYKSTRNLSREVCVMLSLCQSEEANSFLENCCQRLGIEFIQANKFISAKWEVEVLINKADLVVGLGRSAYDAMACGRPVIVYDNRSYMTALGDGYVRDILGLSIKNNCSGRYFRKEFSEAEFIEEIKKYNSNDGVYFRNFALRELDIVKQVDKYFAYWKNLKNNEYKLRKKRITRIVGSEIYHFASKIKKNIKF